MKHLATFLFALVLAALGSAPAFADTIANTQQQSISLFSWSTVTATDAPSLTVDDSDPADTSLLITFSNFGIAPTDEIESASISFSVSGPNGDIAASTSEIGVNCPNGPYTCPYLASDWYAYAYEGSAYVTAPAQFASATYGSTTIDLLADGFASDLLSNTPITLWQDVDLTAPEGGSYYWPGYTGSSTWYTDATADYSLTATLNVTYSAPPPPAVSEPSTLLLLGTSLLGTAGIFHRRLIS